MQFAGKVILEYQNLQKWTQENKKVKMPKLFCSIPLLFVCKAITWTIASLKHPPEILKFQIRTESHWLAKLFCVMLSDCNVGSLCIYLTGKAKKCQFWYVFLFTLTFPSQFSFTLRKLLPAEQISFKQRFVALLLHLECKLLTSLFNQRAIVNQNK